MWFILRPVLGVLCLCVGLFALVTPLTPGAWLILIGLELLGLGFLLPKKWREAWQKWKAETWRKIVKKWNSI